MQAKFPVYSQIVSVTTSENNILDMERLLLIVIVEATDMSDHDLGLSS